MEIFDWFWQLHLDDLIIPWVKANMLPVSMAFVLLQWWVKRTPSDEDDKLIEQLRSVLPMMKRK